MQFQAHRDAQTEQYSVDMLGFIPGEEQAGFFLWQKNMLMKKTKDISPTSSSGVSSMESPPDKVKEVKQKSMKLPPITKMKWRLIEVDTPQRVDRNTRASIYGIPPFS